MSNEEWGEYTVRTMANITGLSPEGIRYYERQGFIRSKRDKKSGYRLYDLMVLRVLRTAIKFRNMGFNVKETSDLLNVECQEDLMGMLKAQKEKISQEIMYKQMILKKLEVQLEQIESYQDNKGVYRIVRRPGLYRLDFYHDQDLITDSKLFPLLHQLMRLQPIARGYLFNDVIRIQKKKEKEAHISLIIFEEDARRLGLDQEKDLSYLPPCTCLYTTTDDLTLEVLLQGITYAQSKCYRAAGEIMFGEISIYHNSSNAAGYDVPNEIWIPISSSDL